MINEYEIVAKGDPENKSEYEEISVDEFLRRENATEDEICSFYRKYSAINIHQLVAKSTLNDIWETLEDTKTDPRLSKLNAIVFLSLKQKGRGVTQEPVSQEEYTKIIQYCLDNGIPFGSDSCGAGKLLKSLSKEQYDKIIGVVEPCEATGFSFYCDVDAKYFPCSFMANEMGDWNDGIDMLSVSNFTNDVWNNPKTIAFRNKVGECNKCLGGCCHYKL